MQENTCHSDAGGINALHSLPSIDARLSKPRRMQPLLRPGYMLGEKAKKQKKTTPTKGWSILILEYFR